MSAACKILTVVGARPQFVKAAALSRVLGNTQDVHEVLVHTGQHFDQNMSSVFFEELGITEPKYNLDIHGLGHGAMTGRMLEGLEEILLSEAPDALIVYGDTNSTLAGALAAAKLNLPIAHIEAGLRSFNRKMPEEINRVLVDHVSQYLFCPTQTSVDNLTNEGIRKDVYHCGDVMYDATLHAREHALANSSAIEGLGLSQGQFALLTLHRAENTDNLERLRDLISFLESEAKDLEIVFPVHPRTRSILEKNDLKLHRIRQIDPVGYFDMHRLLADAARVYTDSGGLQKEAYFHQKPCVTLRDETEWVETIEAGWNHLWRQDGKAKRSEIHDYGDGKSSEKIVEILLSRLR